MRCPSCHHDNRAERRFCAECGAALAALCAACGASNEPGERFCGGCGERLRPAAPAPGAPTPAPEPEAALPAGERRQLTVLFCDLVGSTAIASQLDPEDWHRISKGYQQAAADAVRRFGGHVDKFLGDGLVCFFGYPHAHEDDAERAVRAGLAIVEQVSGLGSQVSVPSTRHPAPNPRLSVRVAIHTGLVVVGRGGGDASDVFGDTPNIAARAQAVAEPDSVVITAATQRLVAGQFVVDEPRAEQLKGLSEPVVLYRVRGLSGVRGRLLAAAARGLTPFVGREHERRLLLDRWEQVQGGTGQVVLITGEAGIGKSRLVQQFKEDLGTTPHTWIECGGSPFFSQTPFHAVAELMQRGFAWESNLPEAERVAALEQALGVAGLNLAEAAPLVAPLLNVRLPDRVPARPSRCVDRTGDASATAPAGVAPRSLC